MAEQWFIPGFGQVLDDDTDQYFVPGFGQVLGGVEGAGDAVAIANRARHSILRVGRLMN